jgi:hypothetical protein
VAELLVLTIRAFENGRDYSAQVIDMCTFNFADFAARRPATGSLLLAGPRWKGVRPKGSSR